ncbi:hypothetical protein ANN_18568 [Periplaneta americana]|uniref:Uncharacterized protein n=1 Tax=Periplaneta americana TaxID=6978 RepID=A0ABQ8SR73_PERAM|nr:hypothetical protein ANN_18568 [Periplaneta americana]
MDADFFFYPYGACSKSPSSGGGGGGGGGGDGSSSNSNRGEFDPVLWIEFGVAQWSERLNVRVNIRSPVGKSDRRCRPRKLFSESSEMSERRKDRNILQVIGVSRLRCSPVDPELRAGACSIPAWTDYLVEFFPRFSSTLDLRLDRCVSPTLAAKSRPCVSRKRCRRSRGPTARQRLQSVCRRVNMEQNKHRQKTLTPFFSRAIAVTGGVTKASSSDIVDISSPSLLFDEPSNSTRDTVIKDTDSSSMTAKNIQHHNVQNSESQKSACKVNGQMYGMKKIGGQEKKKLIRGLIRTGNVADEPHSGRPSMPEHSKQISERIREAIERSPLKHRIVV